MIYKMILKKIESGSYDKNDLLKKMDVYLLCDRITDEEYRELKEKMDAQAEEEQTEGEASV